MSHMPFIDYTGTKFGPWLFPIIPRDATLSEGSSITQSNLGKIPGLKSGGVWAGFARWTEVGSIRADKQERLFSIWDAWYQPERPTIGINARLFPAVDIDINSPLARLAQDVAFGVFGPTIIRGRPNSEKRLLMYRLDQEKSNGLFITKARRVYAASDGDDPLAIEILGKGQQYLIEGRHPSGVDYKWVDDSGPLVAGVDTLSKITPGRVITFFKRLDEEFARCGFKPVRPAQIGGDRTDIDADGQREITRFETQS